MLSQPGPRGAAKEKKKNPHLSKTILWSPLDFLTFENLFLLDSRDDGFLRFSDVIFLDVEDDSNLSSRINTKTFLILFKLPFCLLYKLYSLKYIFLLGLVPVTCWVKI